ncbi:ABC transporter substrate-binding protein [Actinomadura sp. DC4]|uniref:ABC transporter substrate-binding protein n=1 Tax=Actinomadura sp. DC4 TaxID=3055069 RepID=UPI0025B0AA65|nr:ABC transporter substrate-binding protein [Actinomadura sp. DC4]MDN3355015.1 ABC transporter substrate-binding protein [Actinomadura sp. DC4]
MPETAPLRANDPEQLGSYRLTGRLGEGGQGVVYLGEDPEGERVAVKLLHAQFSGDTKARARFAGELASAKRVAPFCTAQILDADVEGDTPYLVSEFIEGPSLRQVVDAEGPRTGGVLQRLAIGTATALAAIHEAGIVHRDFKPTNVLLASDGPRVIDFGIARALDAGGTLTSTTVGTPSYMSPEQISGNTAGPPTDVFAWACTIVYAATGSPPFGQDSIPAVMNRILSQEPSLGMLMGPLREIVTACLAKDARLRPTAQQILLRLLSNDGVSLPGARPAAATEVLNKGAQVAAQNTPPPQWTPPSGPYGAGDSRPWAAYPTGHDTPPPGMYYPGPDTPPSGHHPPGADTPPPGAGMMTRGYTGDGYKTPRRGLRPGVVAAAAAAMVLLVSAGTYAGVKLAGNHKKAKPVPVAGKTGGTFRMAMSAPSSIDPSNAITTADFFVVENLYTGLSQVKPDGTIVNALATQMSSDSGCTNWKFTLRPGTKFSNGEPVDAAAFVRSWNRTAGNKTGGEGYLMDDIKGYDDVYSGGSRTMSGLTTSGPDILQVALTEADCDFGKRVSAPVFVPVPSVAGDASDATYNKQPIGNGPFKVGSYTANSRLTLVRNDSSALTKPKLDEVDVTFAGDLASAVTGFDAGQYDWAELNAASVPTAVSRHSSDGELLKGAIGGMTFLLPINDKGPMKSKEARLAVSYALDRKALIQSAYGGIYTPASSLVPPGVPGGLTNGCTACVHDSVKAKSMAQLAGLGPGSKVTLTVGSTSSYSALVTAAQQQLQTELGWKVDIRKIDLTKFYQDEAGKDAEGLYPFGWVADYPTAESFLGPLLSSSSIARKDDGSVGGSNYARYSSPAFDAAMKAARSTADAGQRTKELQSAEKIALDDMALIPLYSNVQYRVGNTKSFVNIGMDYLGYPVLTTTARK